MNKNSAYLTTQIKKVGLQQTSNFSRPKIQINVFLLYFGRIL